MAGSDFVFEKTRGQRPNDFRQRMTFNAALLRLASEDASIHQFMSEVTHLVSRQALCAIPRSPVGSQS